ncbi:hypothetical protein DM02DRAFT_664166 [Periconia macrospinosa]|uniref:Uncharacterized protein n=1 Tax=Periconia macrospinosa TaxID=97972 RepID=A0A2V1D1B3_9PLEO|nr:hypothetical protein DM02DRAFT_664166 [Periconia macrospinosa]
MLVTLSFFKRLFITPLWFSHVLQPSADKRTMLRRQSLNMHSTSEFTRLKAETKIAFCDGTRIRALRNARSHTEMQSARTPKYSLLAHRKYSARTPKYTRTPKVVNSYSESGQLAVVTCTLATYFNSMSDPHRHYLKKSLYSPQASAS